MTAIHRRTLFLLAAAALGAAGMLLGPDNWFGLDIGPLGAAVVYGALWLWVVHMARHADAAFPETASPAERQAWVALVFTLLISFHYANFLAALPGLGDSADRISNPASRHFGINLGMLVVGWIVAAAVLRGRHSEPVALDERDLRIERDASRIASGLLASMMVGLVVLLASLPDEVLRPWMRPLVVGSALVGLLIVSVVAQNAWLVVQYRRQS